MLHRLITTVGFFITIFNVQAQNVGIGTTTPVNKLTVDGKVNITDSLGIGTSMPESILDIESLGTAGDVGQVKLMAPNMTNTSFTRYAQGRNSTIGNKIEWRFDYSGNGNQWNAHTFGFSGLQPFVAFTFNQRVGIGTLTPSNKLSVIGNADIAGNLGIGTTAPSAKLDVSGNIKIADGTQGAGKILTSDANGLASWALLTGLTNNGTTAGNTPYWNGTSWVTNSSNIFNNGGNVGIGTITPQNKLSIGGTTNITGNLGIGTASPEGELHVKSLSSSTSTLDQQNIYSNATLGAASGWQSFTAGISGRLTQIELDISSQSQSGSSAGTIKIFNGEGINGTLLFTGSVTILNAPGFKAFNIPNLVNVITGNKYTIQFLASTTQAVATNTNNPYSGGMSNFSAYDLLFKTYVANTYVDALFIYDAKVGIGTTTPSNSLSVNGKANFLDSVGIGLGVPMAKLDIAGNIKIADGTQGAGRVLTSDANGLATWTTPSTNYGWALTGNSGTTTATNFIGTTDNRSLRFRTNNNQSMIIDSLGRIGIGTNNPAAKLHIKTGALVCDDATQRFFVNGNYKWDIGGFASSYEISRSGVAVDFFIDGANGNVGIGTTAPTAKLSVNGAANNTTGSWGVFSDARIKTINTDFTDGLNVIKNIHPVKFNYNANAPFKADDEQIGIIAQELENIAPYMVSQKQIGDIKDLREVNNQAYVFLLINAVKELNIQNQQLKSELDTLKTRSDERLTLLENRIEQLIGKKSN